MAGSTETQEIDAALARGELLTAYDSATKLLAGGATQPRIRYLRTLALARMGETGEALRELETADGADDEDSLALRGRLLKDMALRTDAPRSDLFRQASEAYLAAHQRAGGYFSLINAATLAHLAGDGERARALAAQVLTLPAVVTGESFYALATAAEAAVLIGDHDRAATVLGEALARDDATMGARATTARQLRLLAEHAAEPAVVALATKVMPPPVVVYSGHMFRPDPATEAAIATRLDAALERDDVRIAFGAAAAGADILVAEAVLRRGGELNIVLPFPAADFIAASVRPYGEAWQPRFAAVLSGAHSVTCATTAAFVGDPQQFDYGNQVAMGQACLRAEHLCTRAQLLAVRDAAPGRKRGGTGSMVARWQASGRSVVTIPSGAVDRQAETAALLPASDERRESRSIIFTDFSGYSRLDEHQLPRFLAEVMGRMAETLAGCGREVLFRNTWGDALFAVIATPVAAADLALSLAERLHEVDPGVLGLPAGSGMRIGVHHGPLYRAPDPITGKRGFFGSEVTYAARLEPVTPVGKVYVTQPFAALLALAGDRRFRCQYVGPVSLAKGFGTLPMHRLTRSDA